jgi:DNA-binding response OmpR family regulator
MSAHLTPAAPVRAEALPHHVILADADAEQCEWVEPMLPSAASVTRVSTQAELELALAAGKCDLVIAAARLETEGALETLSRVRSGGDRTPFIVYSSLREPLMRVLVSQVDEALLSSRVLDLQGLARTARMVLDRPIQSD